MTASLVCGICRAPLDIPGRVWTRDCGGDCLACMADAGDPECEEALAPPVWLPIDSAPKDRSILLWEKGEMHVGFWNDSSASHPWTIGGEWFAAERVTLWQPLSPSLGAPE